VLHHLRFKTDAREELVRSTFAFRAAFSILGWTFAILLSSFSGRLPFLGRMVDVEVRIWAASIVLFVEGLLFVPYYWLRRKYPDRERILQTGTATVDVLMATLYIYSIGGISFGAAPMFYSLIIVFAASVLTLGQTRYVISLCVLLYTGLFYLEWNGLLSARSDPGTRVAGEYMGLYFLGGFGMLVFGVVAYQIARDYRGRERLMEVGSFVLGLSHELKTPLTPVLISSQVLVSELKDEPMLSLARNISRGASNLNSRIDELLDLAKGEIGMLQLKAETLDVLKLLNDILEDVAPVALSRSQTLTSQLPRSLPSIKADKVRLRQIVLNLLNNAFKFTPEGGKIILKAGERDANLIVEVKDTGPGIGEDEQGRLFKPYQQLESDRERLSGLGLGLALCKTLVELHGGRIWVKSRVGKGSTFGFSLPLEGVGRQKKKS